MKFMKTFKMGFNMFALEKMIHPKSIGVSKSSLGKMYAAEMASKAVSRLKKQEKTFLGSYMSERLKEQLTEEEEDLLRDEYEYYDEWRYGEAWEENISLEEYNDYCKRRDY